MPALTNPLRPGDVVRVRGERWRVSRYLSYPASALVEADGCDGSNGGLHGAFLLPFETIERVAAAATQPRLVSLAAWRHAARHTLGNAAPQWTALRSAARADFELLPFQLEPALALTRGDGCRFLIADEVGLGKTIQAGLMVAELFERQPDARAMVVAPAGLREQWCSELRRRFDLEPQVLDAISVARITARLPADVNPWMVTPLIVTSIDYVKRPDVVRSLEALIWDVVVFDEAHGLCGHSDRAAAAAALGARGRNVVMLTATPHSGDDQAFSRLCALGNLTDRSPLLLFRRTRSDVGSLAHRRTTLLRVRPTEAEAAMHAALNAYARLVWQQSSLTGGSARLAMIVLGRRACSSAASLARSIERRLLLLAGSKPALRQLPLPLQTVCESDEEPEADLSAPGLRNAVDERRRLEQIFRLAREAALDESKFAALRRFLRRAKQPAIVFTEYRDTLDQLSMASSQLAIAQLHGGLTVSERSRAVREFTEGNASLLLATDAAGEGLNLHHRCRLVISLELPWTPLRLEQRAGRVDRLGQQHRVHALHFVAAGTCEESVLVKIARRLLKAKAALGSQRPIWPRESDVANSIFGDQLLPEFHARTTPSVVPGAGQPALHENAVAETERLVLARQLRTSTPSRSASRPVITSTRRRRALASNRIWVFRMLLADAGGCEVWESVIGLSRTGAPVMSGSTADIRAALVVDSPIDRAVSKARAHTLISVREMLSRPVDLMVQREVAIMRALQQRHARMAADLVQHGLFDRRIERAATAQSVLLEQALSHSTERHRFLTGLTNVRDNGCELVFAIAID